MRELRHLSEIFKNYDTFLIDLWGVVHNGVKLNPKAIEAVDNLTRNSKKIIFLSNAPRPSSKVVNFLLKMNMSQKYLTKVMTSGEAALNSINQNKFGKTFFHLGPERDANLFEKVKKNKTTLEKCNYILCTGLFDERETKLDWYKTFLKNHTSKKLICTNPDLTVHRGNKEEYCAGFIAKIFEDLGGDVIYYGKPHKEIYKMCIGKGEKVLAIGDNLRTDIKGANNMNIDCIFISEGVHREECNNISKLDLILEDYKVQANFFQKQFQW